MATVGAERPRFWPVIDFFSAVPFMAAFLVYPGVWASATWGGLWILFPFWVVATALDAVVGLNTANRDVETPSRRIFWHHALTWMWVPMQPLAILYVWYQVFLGDHLSIHEKVGVVGVLGAATAIGIAVGHDLVHRRSRWERWCGEFLMSSVSLGYYATEHVYVHHPHVATPRDPVTARRGENVYSFALRATFAGLAACWDYERHRLERRGLPVWHRSNPFWRYAFGMAVWLAIAIAMGGWWGVVAFFGSSIVAVFALRGIDYIEHYALLRRYIGKSRFERTQPHHSWNAAHRCSAWFAFNVQRHSDHHYRPTRPYPLLQHYDEDEAPQLPFNYLVCHYLTLFPPLWRRIIEPRVEAWRKHFYPDIEDWTAYDSPLFARYPEKLPVIAEVMAGDRTLGAWLERHPAAILGQHCPEAAHLSLTGLELGSEIETAAQSGLVRLFYRLELSLEEMERELAALTNDVDPGAAAEFVREWFEDRFFQLALHRLRGDIEEADAEGALARMIEAAVLHCARHVDILVQPDRAAASRPDIVAVGALARSSMQFGGTFELVMPAARDKSFAGRWYARLGNMLREIFADDWPCRLVPRSEAPGANEESRILGGDAAPSD